MNYDGSDITVHGMNSAATANLTDGANNLQNISADDITLKGLSATNTNSVDVYLAVVPGTEQSVGFSVTIGGVTYSTTRTAMAAGFCSCCLGASCQTSAFAGMYESSAVITAIKNILNIGVVIVLIQSNPGFFSETTSAARRLFSSLILA